MTIITVIISIVSLIITIIEVYTRLIINPKVVFMFSKKYRNYYIWRYETESGHNKLDDFEEWYNLNNRKKMKRYEKMYYCTVYLDSDLK